MRRARRERLDRGSRLDIERAEAFTFKITRDAELELGEGITQSLVDALSSSLKKRKLGDRLNEITPRAA